MNRLRIQFALSGLLALSLAGSVSARDPYSAVHGKGQIAQPSSTVATRSDCIPGTSRYDMSINNVRCALLLGGDVWWDTQNGVYIVPKVQPGTGAKAVSSIFAGAVWLGVSTVSGALLRCGRASSSRNSENLSNSTDPAKNDV